MGDLREEIVRLGERMKDEDDAASDLWSWLPSHAEAQKHHGDFWQTFRPSNSDVMVEAATFLAALKLTPEQTGTAVAGTGASEPGQYFSCPCGDDHASHTDDDSTDAP